MSGIMSVHASRMCAEMKEKTGQSSASRHVGLYDCIKLLQSFLLQKIDRLTVGNSVIIR